jgi:hypothetical protein
MASPSSEAQAEALQTTHGSDSHLQRPKAVDKQGSAKQGSTASDRLQACASACELPTCPSSSTGHVKVLVCVSGSVAAIKLGELISKLHRAAFVTRLASTKTGSIFLDHSQHALPEDTELLRDAFDNEQVSALQLGYELLVLCYVV